VANSRYIRSKTAGATVLKRKERKVFVAVAGWTISGDIVLGIEGSEVIDNQSVLFGVSRVRPERGGVG